MAHIHLQVSLIFSSHPPCAKNVLVMTDKRQKTNRVQYGGSTLPKNNYSLYYQFHTKDSRVIRNSFLETLFISILMDICFLSIPPITWINLDPV